MVLAAARLLRMQEDPARMTIAIDASPCVGARTGVGRYVEDLLSGLGAPSPVLVFQGHRGALPGQVAGAGAACARYDLAGGRLGAWLRLPWVLRRLGAVLYHSTSTIAVPGPGWSGAVVATVHDCYPLSPGATVPARHRRLFRALLDAVLRRADVVVVPSAASAQELAGHGWRGPTEVVPWGILPAAPRARPPGAPAAYLLTVGAIEARKGFHLLAAAAPPMPWFHLGPVRDDPGGAIAAAMDRAGCRRLGFVGEEERIAWLQHAAILAMPSQTEGFGYPALEAMAAGVPVIAFPNGGLREVLGEAACWSAPDRLAADLADLSRDGDRRSGLAVAGRERARGFTIARMAAAHRALYRRLGAA